MKKFIQEGIEAFPTSKKHLIGFDLAILCTVLLITFNLLGWNEVEYNDTYPFIGDVRLHTYFFQSIATLILGWGANFTFEFFQQKNIPIDSRPTWKDTKWDCNYMALSAWVGMSLTALLW